MSAPPTTIPGIVSIVLLFADGLVFGLAIKKGIMSLILVIIGIILAGAIGLTIPFISLSDVWSHIVGIFASQVTHIGGIFYAFPVFWIIGFGIGLWKG